MDNYSKRDYLVEPLFSADCMAISRATGSSSGRSGRRSEVRKLNMSGGDRTLQRRETMVK